MGKTSLSQQTSIKEERLPDWLENKYARRKYKAEANRHLEIQSRRAL